MEILILKRLRTNVCILCRSIDAVDTVETIASSHSLLLHSPSQIHIHNVISAPRFFVLVINGGKGIFKKQEVFSCVFILEVNFWSDNAC